MQSSKEIATAVTLIIELSFNGKVVQYYRFQSTVGNHGTESHLSIPASKTWH